MNIQTPLMSHQSAAVEKVERLRVGALFMEMGTGKSLTALFLIALRRAKISRALWFVPVALKESTRLEILKHAPNAQIHVFDEKTTPKRLKAAPPAEIYLVGIESMSASRRLILSASSLCDSRAFVIVDESSYIKGHDAARTKWITRIAQNARYRLILTGTPVSQGVVDLFAQLRFLSPEILGYSSFYSFARNHLEFSDKYPGVITRSHNTGFIAAKMAPYVYQVTKAQCLDLPSKLCLTRTLTMSHEQEILYQRAKDELLLEITDRDVTSDDIFRLFTALQQIVCGFWNRIEHRGHGQDYQRLVHTFEAPHQRLDLLCATIREAPPDAKIIIWAKYRRCIADIAARLESEFGASPTLFYGDLNEKQRAAEVARFRESARFLVATPSCGAHGLTLNEAHHVIFYTDGFKYSERLQSEDRCHRIGQDWPVTYVSLVCRRSIDERIQKALESKGSVVDAFRREVERIKDKKTMKQAIQAL